MSTHVTAELAEFCQFLGQQVALGVAISPEDALRLWRSNHPHPGAEDDTVAALREALVELDAGERGREFAEFDRELRTRHGYGAT